MTKLLSSKNLKTLLVLGFTLALGHNVLAAGINTAQLKSRFTSWGISPSNKSNINLSGAWKKFKKKRDIVVAVIDTGIDPSHPFLKKNLHSLKGKASTKNYGIDFSKGRKHQLRPMDDHGHGTHIAGIVKQVYPGVKILPLKYYNKNATGRDNLKSTIKALRYAVDMNVDIINYSGGGPEPAREELKILREAERKGILVVAAAGNEESNIDIKSNKFFPASYGLKNIISVTAHNKYLKTLPSSNFGRKTVDISAPGHRIKSALPFGRAGFLTGTSQATAFVTGVAAMIKAQFPKITAKQLKAIIKQSAKKEVTLLTKCSTGGRLDATKAQTIAAKLFKTTINTRKLANKTSKGKIIYRYAN